MKTKDCGMRIRVDRELRDEFVRVCRAQDRPASEVLRDFMRLYTQQQPPGQRDLFMRKKSAE